MKFKFLNYLNFYVSFFGVFKGVINTFAAAFIIVGITSFIFKSTPKYNDFIDKIVKTMLFNIIILSIPNAYLCS